MPKQLYEIKDFSGGLNAYADPRDIGDSQFSQNWNVVVDKDGILRVVGSAVESIYSRNILNNNFQSGFGLFQFGTDYGWNIIDGSFGLGFETGTIADVSGAGGGTVNMDIEATSTYSTTDNYYKDMTIFIYEGTGAGQSRRIDSYTGSTRLIVVEEAFDTALDTTSKYMIFRWKSVGFATTRGTDGSDTDVENFITNGYTTNFFQVDNLASNDSVGYSSNSSYYAVSKQASISAEASADLGYLEYKGPSDSNLTLESGVEYTISFECAFKNKYYNDVSDGDADGSAIGTGDVVPNIELFSDTVTNGTTNQTNPNAGLYLQSGGRWIEKGAQTNYAHATSSYANYVVNGDFRDAGAWTGGSGNWDEYTFFNASTVEESSLYNGVDGTLKFDWSSYGAAIVPDNNYVITTCTLDTNTYYHLNFQYLGAGVAYRLRDTTNNTTLVDWTSDGTESTFVGGEDDDENDVSNYKWNFPFQNRNSNQPSSSDYIKFYVPYDEATPGAATVNVTLQLSPGISREPWFTYIHGVSIRKARNDLVTMGYKNNGNNPFLGAVNTWSRYSTSFKIPSDYNNASDWIFRVRGGSYSRGEGTYPDGVTSSSVNNQEVYIRNIQITGDTEDTITLLQGNTESKSKIHLNSENQGNTWNENWIIYPEANAIPNFNFANGVLRISDSNFKTNNNNILMYYDKYASSTYTNLRDSSGWKTKQGFLSSPCNLTAHIFETSTSTTFTNPLEIYNAIDLQNELFNEITFTTKGEGANSAIATDWRYDCFGPESTLEQRGMGIITRYIADNTKTPSVMYQAGGSTSNWLKSYETYLEPNIDNQNHPTTAGLGNVFVHNAGQTDSGGHSNSMYTEALWPVKCLIPMEELRDFVSDGNINASSVHSVNFEVDFELQGCRQNNNGGDGGNGDFPNSTHPMYFKVEGGTFSRTLNSNEYENFVNGYSYFSDMSPLLSNKDTINFGINQHTNAAYRWSHVLDGGVPWTTDTGTGSITMLTPIDDIYQDTITGSSDRMINFKIRLSGTLYYERGNVDITENKDLIIQIKDILDDVVGTNQVWGTEGHLERDIATWSTASPNACTKTSYWNCYQFASYTRYFINKLDVNFYDDGILEETNIMTEPSAPNITTGSNAEIFLNFSIPDEEVSPSGWAERKFQIAITSVDIFGCESYLNIFDETTQIIDANKCPEVTFYMTEEFFNNEFVETTKIYMKSTDSDTWYLQWYLNHKGNNVGNFYSNSSGMFDYGRSYNDNLKAWTLEREVNKDFNEINSYESESMVKQEDALSKETLTCRYKTSVIANNRLYVGNIKQSGVIHGDRMIKSPINKYNILPASNFIDVAINDGDEITALEYYKDKILQFKKKKVFVIDVSGDYESLADTFDNVGVKGSYSVVKTPKGIAWANENGCYLYDGNSLKNLIEGVLPTSQAYENPGISNNRWSPSSSLGECVIGYDKNKDTLVINFSKNNEAGVSAPSGATYHFKTNSWTLLTTVWNDNTGDVKTGNMSNMITSKNGDVLFYHVTSDGANGVNTLRKWNHDSNDNLSTKLFTFTTKDITFGNINIRKKVYGIYITYRVRTNGTDSNVTVSAAINGSSNFNITFSDASKFAFGQSNSSGTACYGSSTLDETDGIWKTAHLKPTTPSELNNIVSIMLKFSGASVPYDFEINDISLVYKTKSLR